MHGRSKSDAFTCTTLTAGSEGGTASRIRRISSAQPVMVLKPCTINASVDSHNKGKWKVTCHADKLRTKSWLLFSFRGKCDNAFVLEVVTVGIQILKEPPSPTPQRGMVPECASPVSLLPHIQQPPELVPETSTLRSLLLLKLEGKLLYDFQEGKSEGSNKHSTQGSNHENQQENHMHMPSTQEEVEVTPKSAAGSHTSKSGAVNSTSPATCHYNKTLGSNVDAKLVGSHDGDGWIPLSAHGQHRHRQSPRLVFRSWGRFERTDRTISGFCLRQQLHPPS